MSLTCASCGVIYRHKQSLNRHIKASHPSQSQRIVPPAVPDCGSLMCTECKSDCGFKSRLDFMQHLSAVHGVSGSHTVIMVFDSIEEFRGWKVEMELHTGSFYVIARTNKSKDCQTLVYECNRSGHYVPKGKGMRHLKKQGSRKISGYCPSGLKVQVGKDGKCTVSFFNKHWGHAVEHQHLTLTADEPLQAADSVYVEPFQLSLAEEAGRYLEPETVLTEVCDGKVRDQDDAQQPKEKEFVDVPKYIDTLVETATNVEEVVAATELTSAVPHVVAAARDSGGPNINSDGQKISNKRKLGPQHRFPNFHSFIKNKRAKKRASLTIKV